MLYTNKKLNLLLTEKYADCDIEVKEENALDVLIEKGLLFPYQILVDENFTAVYTKENGMTFLDILSVDETDENTVFADVGSSLSDLSIAEILERIKDTTKIISIAEDIAVDEDQQWENETTVFVFKDGSKIKINNCFVEAKTISK